MTYQTYPGKIWLLNVNGEQFSDNPDPSWESKPNSESDVLYVRSDIVHDICRSLEELIYVCDHFGAPVNLAEARAAIARYPKSN
jgi:hypothetical protein